MLAARPAGRWLAHPFQRLAPASLHRAADPYGLAVLGHRPPREIEAARAQQIDKSIIGQDRCGVFGVD